MVKPILGFLRWAPWGVAAVTGFMTLQSLLGQAAIGADLMSAMSGVEENVRAAGRLTGETAQALAPLSSTSAALREMNGKLTATAGDVQEMNAAMSRIADRQRAILTGLGSLNGHMGDVLKDLESVDQQNRALLGTSQNLARQTGAQAASLDSLSGLTEDATAHLRTINRRFAFLSRL